MGNEDKLHRQPEDDTADIRAERVSAPAPDPRDEIILRLEQAWLRDIAALEELAGRCLAHGFEVVAAHPVHGEAQVRRAIALAVAAVVEANATRQPLIGIGAQAITQSARGRSRARRPQRRVATAEMAATSAPTASCACNTNGVLGVRPKRS